MLRIFNIAAENGGNIRVLVGLGGVSGGALWGNWGFFRLPGGDLGLSGGLNRPVEGADAGVLGAWRVAGTVAASSAFVEADGRQFWNWFGFF